MRWHWKQSILWVWVTLTSIMFASKIQHLSCLYSVDKGQDITKLIIRCRMLFTCLISFPLFLPFVLQWTLNIPVAISVSDGFTILTLSLSQTKRDKYKKIRHCSSETATNVVNIDLICLHCSVLLFHEIHFVLMFLCSVFDFFFILFIPGICTRKTTALKMTFLLLNFSNDFPLNACLLKNETKKSIFHILSHFILWSNYPFHSEWCCCGNHPSVTMYDVNLSQLLISNKLHLWMKIAMNGGNKTTRPGTLSSS